MRQLSSSTKVSRPLRLTSFLLLAALSRAQSPLTVSPLDLNTLLDHLSTDAAAYRLTLPSLGAEESITSQSIGIGPFRARAEAKALFRVTRKSPGGPLQESRQITELNGKPVSEDHPVRLPLTFTGAFGNALEIFFAPALRPCFDFTLVPQLSPDGSRQINFLGRPNGETDPACAHTPSGVAGFARIDPVTRHIRHLERTVPSAIAEPRHLATFVSIDYAPTPVGQESFWLPTSITARLAQRHGSDAEFIAHYANYHRFTGTVTLLPDVTPLPSSSAPPL